MAAGGSISDVSFHLDINGVCLGRETAGGEETPPESYAQVMLANGTEYTFDGETKESYKLYVWRVKHPGSNSDPELRKVRKEALRHFVDELPEDHPIKPKVTEQYARLRKQLEESPIFPGLGVLIDRALESVSSPHFVFRTFGDDGKVIVKYLRERYPDFVLEGGLFDKDGHFQMCTIDEDGAYEPLGKKESDPVLIRNLLHVGHWVIKDCFERWREGGEACSHGKPFFYSDSGGRREIMMDDNLEFVEWTEQRSIVCPMDVDSGAVKATESVRDRLCKINPVEAALDPEYLSTKAFSLLS